MKKNKPEVVENPEENIFESVLDEVVRKGAQRMLETALNLEVEEFCRSHAERRDEEKAGGWWCATDRAKRGQS